VVEVDELGEARIVIKLWTPFCKDLELDLEKSNIFHMMEFKIDPHARTVTKEVIDDTINSEFATMPPIPSQSTSLTESLANERSTSLSTHKRCGFTAIFGDGGSFIGWAKWDMVSRSLHSTVYYGPHESGGEPIVVRATKQIVKEDNGSGTEEETMYVGSYVYNEEENQSYFLLFDGETNRQICRLKMPQRVPFGFHGQFISGEELEFHYRHHQEIDKQANSSCPIQWIRFFIRDIILDFTQQLMGGAHHSA
jgi:carotenoid cleavage dioxygenase-like enzyme